MLGRSTLICGVLAVALLRSDDVAACSCMGPHDTYVAGAAENEPLNAHARMYVASRVTGKAVMRVHGGATVDATQRSWMDGLLTFVELTPKSTLQPATLYEIAVIDASRFPSTTVLGAFKTGTASDTTAPKLESIGTAVGKGNLHAGGGSCGIAGPWIEIGPVKASDPGRADAKLLYAIWTADAKGNVDPSKSPARLIQPYENMVTVGRRSLCDPLDMPLAVGKLMPLAIAAVDEAGNTSTPRKVQVDLRAFRPTP